jgi:hypothetical protein
VPAVSYAQRVAVAFVAFIDFYMYLHADQGVRAADLDETKRGERGDHAVGLAKVMQRATLALIGSHRRRTYAHDLVYGTYQLYMLFGKPWNAATEGNEHAHQNMKQFFHTMSQHGPKGHCDAFNCLRLGVVFRTQVRDFGATKIVHNAYAAQRMNRVLAEQAVAREGVSEGQDQRESSVTKRTRRCVSVRACCGRSTF